MNFATAILDRTPAGYESLDLIPAARRLTPLVLTASSTNLQAFAVVAKKPFIYLSAGVSNETFNDTLELAAEAGTNFSGVLCGRATWKEGIPVYAKQGAKAFHEWLETTGVQNIENVNNALKAASPWYLKFGANSLAELG